MNRVSGSPTFEFSEGVFPNTRGIREVLHLDLVTGVDRVKAASLVFQGNDIIMFEPLHPLWGHWEGPQWVKAGPSPR